MKKIRNLVIGGIENKVFNLILVAVFLTALAFMGGFLYQNKMLTDLSNESSQKQKEAIAETTGMVMDQVVTLSLSRNTETESMLVDEFFHGLQTRVEMLAQYAQKLYKDPESVTPASFEGPDPAKNGEITAQLILAEGTEMDDALAQRIGIAADMTDMMVSMFGASEETNSCFIALPEGAFLVVDDRSASKYSENGEPISYDPRTRPWYQQAVEAGKLIFTDVEVDAFTGDIGIVCAMPVYVDGELTAVVGSDLFLTSMQAGVQASDENGGFICIVNQNGHVVFSPKTPARESSGRHLLYDRRADEDRGMGADLGVQPGSDGPADQVDARQLSADPAGDRRHVFEQNGGLAKDCDRSAADRDGRDDRIGNCLGQEDRQTLKYDHKANCVS